MGQGRKGVRSTGVSCRRAESPDQPRHLREIILSCKHLFLGSNSTEDVLPRKPCKAKRTRANNPMCSRELWAQALPLVPLGPKSEDCELQAVRTRQPRSREK